MLIRMNIQDLPAEGKKLRAGDEVLLSGTVYTARDAAHKRLTALLDEGKELPFDLQGAAIYYAGPTQTMPGAVIGSCGPTTSSRMDVFAPRLLDLGLSAMIGKGGRNQAVVDAIVRNGAVYFCAVGGAGALAASAVRENEVIAFDDLGCESIKRLRVEDLRVYVAIDSTGGSLFEKRRYDTILLDLDDTVFDFHACERQAFLQTMTDHGFTAGEEEFQRYSAINEQLWQDVEKGLTDQATLKLERFRRFFKEYNFAADIPAVQATYAGYLKEQRILFPGAEAFCHALHARYRVCGVTNGLADVQRPRLGQSSVAGCFDALCISQEVGASKPDPAMLEAAAGLIGQPNKEKILLIGDRLEADVLAAVRFGCDSVWFNPSGKELGGEVLPTYVVRDYETLTELLEL